jgi:hypothetical protein
MSNIDKQALREIAAATVAHMMRLSVIRLMTFSISHWRRNSA